MAKRYPGASLQLLGPQTQRRITSHDIVCIHTMVGSLAGTDTFFEAGGFSGTESHLGNGGDGSSIQWQDLLFMADANLDGNPRIISIENADTGAPFPKWSGSDVPAFSPAQVERLVDQLVWLCSPAAHSLCPADWDCRRSGIPARFIQDSKPGRRGIGVHRQGIDGNFPKEGPLRGRVAGGERWSTSRGKACPGDRRIRQLVEVIIPRVQKALDAQKPSEAEPSNPTTRGRALVAQGLAEWAKVPSSRVAVRTMRAAIAAALKAGPKS